MPGTQEASSRCFLKGEPSEVAVTFLIPQGGPPLPAGGRPVRRICRTVGWRPGLRSRTRGVGGPRGRRPTWPQPGSPSLGLKEMQEQQRRGGTQSQWSLLTPRTCGRAPGGPGRTRPSRDHLWESGERPPPGSGAVFTVFYSSLCRCAQRHAHGCPSSVSVPAPHGDGPRGGGSRVTRPGRCPRADAADGHALSCPRGGFAPKPPHCTLTPAGYCAGIKLQGRRLHHRARCGGWGPCEVGAQPGGGLCTSLKVFVGSWTPLLTCVYCPCERTMSPV